MVTTAGALRNARPGGALPSQRGALAPLPHERACPLLSLAPSRLSAAPPPLRASAALRPRARALAPPPVGALPPRGAWLPLPGASVRLRLFAGEPRLPPQPAALPAISTAGAAHRRCARRTVRPLL